MSTLRESPCTLSQSAHLIANVNDKSAFDELVDERSIKARMTAGAVEEVNEEVNESVDERAIFVSRDTRAEIDHQGQDEFHQQGERESTNTKSTKKKSYIYYIMQLPIDRVPRQLC